MSLLAARRRPPPTPIVSQSPHIPLVRDPDDFPAIAFPTILLAAVSFSALALSHYITLTIENHLLVVSRAESQQPLKMRPDFYLLPSFYLHFFLRVFFTYTAFTVMHDAAHDSIARQNSGLSFLNSVLGWTSACYFGAPFSVFKKIHLDHHRYTNAVEYDADLWSGGNFRGTAYSSKFHWTITRFVLLPIRCSTLIYHYLIHAAKYMLATWSVLETVRNVIIIGSLILVPLFSSVVFTSINYLFWGFHLPVLGAVLILGLFFDYLPHRPHHTDSDPIAATSLITLWNPPNVSRERLKAAQFTAKEIQQTGINLLTIPLLGQNLHPIHHLYPNIPFYRYSSVYERMSETLHQAGLKAHPLFPLIIEADD